MFESIPAPFLSRMRELEAIDARDREDGTPRPTHRPISTASVSDRPPPWLATVGASNPRSPAHHFES